jgi:hypothetical protein
MGWKCGTVKGDTNKLENLVWDLQGRDHEKDVILKVTEQNVRVFCSSVWQKAVMTLQDSYSGTTA